MSEETENPENKLNEPISDPMLLLNYTLKDIRKALIEIDADIMTLASTIKYQAKIIDRLNTNCLVMAIPLLACSILWWFR